MRQPYLMTGPLGYIGWRNRLLGIDSWAPLTFTNSGSELKKREVRMEDIPTVKAGGTRLEPNKTRTQDAVAFSKDEFCLHVVNLCQKLKSRYGARNRL